MPPSTPLLERASDGLTKLTLAGAQDETSLLSFETELRVLLAATRPRSLDLLVDFTALSECSHACRDVLVRMLQFVLPRTRMVVFVANQPATRGLALWISHMAGDRSVNIVPSLDLAEDMLTPSAKRSVPPPVHSEIRGLAPDSSQASRQGGSRN